MSRRTTNKRPSEDDYETFRKVAKDAEHRIREAARERDEQEELKT
jgi:hypothetical protein